MPKSCRTSWLAERLKVSLGGEEDKVPSSFISASGAQLNL
jgi:hypothetical protein